ncbi:MAG TPA: type II/IV secretion system ATPase subunit [Dehalococcoidales bacterium]|nr:type II/IV secretion system ATPase subunit [Dehalococcoidales bacterium]
MAGLPFKLKECQQECGAECGTRLTNCHLYGQLSPDFQEQCQTKTHLLLYLHSIPLEELGMPQFHMKINRGMKSVKNRNLIYRVDDEIFIHILANAEDIRDFYLPIEPCLFGGVESLMDKVEKRLINYVEELAGVDDNVARLKVILDIVDRIVVVNDGTGTKVNPSTLKKNKEGKSSDLKGTKPARGRSLVSLLDRNGAGGEKLVISPIQYSALRYALKRKLLGMGVLEPVIRDTNIEDISCSGVGNIFVEHKIFGGLRTGIGFETEVELDKYVIQLADGIKHPVTFRNPVVDATLQDGSRINLVYGSDVSKRGSNFTIRKFSGVPISILELVSFGSLSYEMAAYLSIMFQENMNCFISGETASGKTTLMNALTTFISPESKIVSIEDTPELQVPHPNWIRGCTREGGKNAEASGVTMFDLLRAALRQRPNYIIIGEIRGAEGAIAFQAMQTGHACMSTFHASTVTKLIQRLTGNPINIPKSYVDNLNLVVIAQQVRLPNGSLARRVTSINEIVSYDSVNDAFSFMEVFRWKPIDDSFDARGVSQSYLLEEKVASRRGIPYEKRNQIYSLLKQRAEVLRRIQEQKITGFFELYAVLSKAYREGYFK